MATSLKFLNYRFPLGLARRLGVGLASYLEASPTSAVALSSFCTILQGSCVEAQRVQVSKYSGSKTAYTVYL